MTQQSSPLNRRNFLRGALATAALVPIAGSLASCGSPGSGGGQKAAKTTGATATNPFGLADGTSVDAVIFNGGYKTDYVDFAAKQVTKQKGMSGVKIKVTPETQISTALKPRFLGGTPPDLVDNSGADAIGFNTIVPKLETLDDVFEANNYEGTKIADTLYPNVKDPGTFGGKFVALNYVMTVYGMWYSASLYQKNGWQPPKTWDDALALGAKAKDAGKYLFVWGKEAATYYLTMALDSAIKEGGDEVRIKLENLEKGAWSQRPIQDVFNALAECVSKGYFVPGGAGTQFTAAQAKWSQAEQAILYPSGGWIENEMKDQTKPGFKMTGAPTPTVSSSPKMPYEALRSAAGEPYVVPSQAKNPAGGKELLRAMLSKAAATNFSKTRLAPTIVKGLVPPDGFGSSALVSQTNMLDAAGTNVFNYQFLDYYGMNDAQLSVMNSFLSGQKDVKGLTSDLENISAKAANDSSVPKLKVT